MARSQSGMPTLTPEKMATIAANMLPASQGAGMPRSQKTRPPRAPISRPAAVSRIGPLA